ncbi:DUF7573 domain-containing protein [Haloprofundus salinisoli]|uniref:DUF7573 domain-containing protein n=1 Tax=Haloprofundus salinisoli TaxID=2876193 RepID=UPI001CCB4A16|nr:hypothetical protein [Haloprofundus salinisoli]
MGEDRSLDEFLRTADADSVGDEESTEGDAEEELAERTENAESSSDGDAEGTNPAVVTFRWSPTGATCGSCGETVLRRWRDEETDEFVCIDCKPW